MGRKEYKGIVFLLANIKVLVSHDVDGNSLEKYSHLKGRNAKYMHEVAFLNGGRRV